MLVTRIQQLEDALAIIQSSVSSERHPLLRDELLQIKFGKKPKTITVEPAAELAESLGTLTISPEGDAKYFGPSAGPESLLQFGAEILNHGPANIDDIFGLDDKFPFLPRSRTINLNCEHLLELLPAKPRAWGLCESYLQQGCLKEQFIERDELVNDLLIPVYNRGDPRIQEQDRTFTAHKLAILFFVFAIGARVDLTLPFDSDEADKYYQVGRAALSLNSVLNSPELATVQALLLLSFCHMQGGRRYDIDVACMVAALAVKRAESIGLHRESPQWNFDGKTLHRRRHIFWEAFSFDMILSFNLGRPPTIRTSYIDCKFPVDSEASVNENGEVQPGPDRWRWTFARDVLAWSIENTAMPNVPYSTILEADRKLREFPFPAKYKVTISGFSEEDDTTAHLYMKRHYPSQIRLISALHVHRSYFAQTMLHYASDPLGSPYATSFLASYKAASFLIGIYVKHMTKLPELLMRWFPVWSSLLAAAMVVGSIVVRCPNSTMAPKAYMELGIAVTLFERGSEQSPRAQSGLVILRKLLTRATEVFSHRHENDPPLSNHDHDLGDELEIFGGQTKVLVSNLLSNHRLQPRGPPSPSPPSTGSSTAASSSSPSLNLQEDAGYEWLQGLSDTSMTTTDAVTNAFSPEFIESLMIGNAPLQSAAVDNQQPVLNQEWLAFMEQAGYLSSESAAVYTS